MSEIKTEKIVNDDGDIIITETDENGKLIFYCESGSIDKSAWQEVEKKLAKVQKLVTDADGAGTGKTVFYSGFLYDIQKSATWPGDNK